MRDLDPIRNLQDARRRLAQQSERPAGQQAELNELAARIADHYRTDFITPTLLSGLMRLVEYGLLTLSGALITTIDAGTQALFHAPQIAILAGAPLLTIILINVSGAYRLASLRHASRAIWRAVLYWVLVIVFLSGTLFILTGAQDLSRPFLTTWVLVGIAIFVASRTILQRFVRRWARDGRMERRAVIVGGGKKAETLIRNLEAQPDSDIRICGIFDDRNDKRSPPIVAGYPKLGTIAELVTFSRRTRIDMLIVTLPLSAEKRLLDLLRKLWVLPVDIRLSAHAHELRFRPRSYSFIGDLPFIDVLDRPIADWDWIAKRIFDVAIALFAIILMLPVFVVTAIAVKFDTPGPILFRQKRHGFNNQTIEIFKFRSLRHEFSDPEARHVVTQNDRRVTRVGRIIRKTSIDELPQLFNVLRGELSLVGPRPHAIHALSSHNETFAAIVEGYFGRHKVKPGITGWAQISGWRGEIDQPEKLKRRFEHDLYYIENWSLGFDLYILLMTPISLIRKRTGAY